MLHKKILLRDNNDESYITTYILDDVVENQNKRPVIVISPGGGYEGCSPREGEPIGNVNKCAVRKHPKFLIVSLASTAVITMN